MERELIKEHWEKIYSTKESNEVSWVQETPEPSLSFIHSFNLSKKASIIDIGGGDSKLVDNLLEEGFEDITVLDLSDYALQRTKRRLGERAEKVNWITADVTELKIGKMFDLWHDRAAFHFLTTDNTINKYLENARTIIKKNGFLIMGTFSETGPVKCSGLEAKRYSEETLQDRMKNGFTKIKCINEDHRTPFGTLQNFLFCSFNRN